jgi:hypothetical protein
VFYAVGSDLFPDAESKESQQTVEFNRGLTQFNRILNDFTTHRGQKP